MPINYEKQTYVNGSGATPLSAERLNHNENGTKAAADAVDAVTAELEGRLSEAQLSATIGEAVTTGVAPKLDRSEAASTYVTPSAVSSLVDDTLASDDEIRADLLTRIAALVSGDLSYVQAPRVSAQLGELLTGFVAWFEDSNNRIALGVKPDGSVSIPKLAPETTAAVAAGLPIPSLVTALTGYAGYFKDPAERIPLAFELDGGVVIAKFAASTIEKIKSAVAAPGLLLAAGDSMTAGAGGIPYTDGLSADLAGRAVVQFGYGGQTARSITARTGAHPVMLAVTDNRIPASGPVSVTARDANLDPGTYVGSLVGVPGTMVVAAGNVMTFTRTTSGKATACPPGTPFVTRPDFRGQQVVSWMGRNGLSASDYMTTNIAEDRHALAWAGTNANRSLILSVVPFTTDSADTLARIAALNDAKRQNFPAQFVDVAARMRSADALEEEGVTPTSQDLQDIANGFTPASFRSDEGHFNTAGYRRVRRIVAAELIAREAS